MPLKSFDPSFFVGNRQRLLQDSGAELIVLSANAVLQRAADESYPFHQDRNFWYLTGLDEPEAVLVVDAERSESYVILPPRHERRDLWDGVRDAGKLQDGAGLDAVYEKREGWQRLKQRLANIKMVHTVLPPPQYLKPYEFYANPARRVLMERLKRAAPHVKFEDVRPALTALRQIKQPCELAAIQAAIGITMQSLAVAESQWQDCAFEYEINALMTYEYLRRGAQGHAFEIVVASGAAAATIHYRSSSAPIKHDKPLLIDTGAMVGHYAADITRTFLPPLVSARERAVYEAVARVHAFALNTMKPGLAHRDYEKQVEACMGEELIKLGLTQSTDREAIRRYYPHLTSHHLGLDVHDVATYEEIFAPGMVLTVEPGIYIPEEGIGVRIEDDVLITDTGTQLLGGA